MKLITYEKIVQIQILKKIKNDSKPSTKSVNPKNYIFRLIFLLLHISKSEKRKDISRILSWIFLLSQPSKNDLLKFQYLIGEKK
jgi:hypothetical protein